MFLRWWVDARYNNHNGTHTGAKGDSNVTTNLLEKHDEQIWKNHDLLDSKFLNTGNDRLGVINGKQTLLPNGHVPLSSDERIIGLDDAWNLVNGSQMTEMIIFTLVPQPKADFKLINIGTQHGTKEGPTVISAYELSLGWDKAHDLWAKPKQWFTSPNCSAIFEASFPYHENPKIK